MVNVVVKPTSKLQGTLTAPASKSYTQRMLIAASLSDGTGKVINPLVSEDTQATFRAITALGAQVQKTENNWAIQGTNELKTTNKNNLIDVGESGATLRFMIPIAALSLERTAFLLSPSLERRPIEPLLSSLKMLNIETYPKQINNFQTIVVEGKGEIAGGKISIPGDVSSQFISGLMFACPMAKSDTEIQISTPLESKDYVKMTQEVLAMHQIEVQISEDYHHIHIPGKQTFRPVDCKVPGDFSSAAFLLAASAITNSNVKVNNLSYKTAQGDRAILEILKQMGVKEKISESSIEIHGTGNLLKAVDIDAKNIPDLVPICTVLACYADSQSKIFNAQRLKFKESDRLATIHEELTKMGASINMDESGLNIKGPYKLHGTTINPHNDHRIAMACTIAALQAKAETTIENAECIRKSYPAFYNDLTTIGAEIIGGKLVR